MKKYTQPEVELTKFDSEDILVVSGAGIYSGWDEDAESAADWDN